MMDTTSMVRYGGMSYMESCEMLQAHQQLHMQCGMAPDEMAIQAEQMMAVEMRRRGFEHRHTDPLAVAAATVVAKPAPPSIDEVLEYLRRSVTVQSAAVRVATDAGGSGDFQLVIQGAGLTGLEQTLLKMLNGWLPPGVQLTLPGKSREGFAELHPLYDLELRSRYQGPTITTWEAVTINFQTLATKSAPLAFPAGERPHLPFRVAVVKAAGSVAGIEWPEGSAYVLGPVLIPGKVDNTRTNPDGTPTGAIGDVVDGPSTRAAFEFWTVSKRAFEHQHAVQGGRTLGERDVVILDNICLPAPMTVVKADGTEECFPTDSWLLGGRILEPETAKEALEGKLTSWSIFADCSGRFEPAESVHV